MMKPAVFRSVHLHLSPSPTVSARMRQRVLSQLSTSSIALQRTAEALTPTSAVKERIWQRLHPLLAPLPSSARAPGRWTDLLSLYRSLQKHLVSLRSSPALPGFLHRHTTLQWIATWSLAAILIRISPLVFLAPTLQAEMTVRLVPSSAAVLIQETDHHTPVVAGETLLLNTGAAVETQAGTASIFFHDYALIRLDSHTRLALNDASTLLQPAPEAPPAITLTAGRIWIQGFIPPSLRGLTILTPHGLVTVHEGSVSVTSEAHSTAVEVLNRRATVHGQSQDHLLIAGESVILKSEQPLAVLPLRLSLYEEPWYEENLAKDAVHRSEIALQQRERLARQAGIPPTSALYPVKRLAEKFDAFMTISRQAKIEKKLQFAGTRLSEAAALIEEGETEDAATALGEYRDELIALAGESDDITVQFMVEDSLSQASANIAAALPEDEHYILKKTILEANSLISDRGTAQTEAHSLLALDALAALRQALPSGTNETVLQEWQSVQEHLQSVRPTRGSFSREINQALTSVALLAKEEQSQGEVLDQRFLKDLAGYLPPPPAIVRDHGMTEEEIQSIVAGILFRTSVTLSLPTSQLNQLLSEIRLLQKRGFNDRLHVLRKLQDVLPEELRPVVRHEIRSLRTSVSQHSGQGL